MNERRVGYFEGRIDAYRGVLDLIEDTELDCFLADRENCKSLFVKLLKNRLLCRIESNSEELKRMDEQKGATN